MKTCVLLLALVWGTSAQTPPRSRAQGNCEQGNGRVTTNGVQSATTTRVMRSFPGCTVTIFNAGTVTLSTIFSDDAGTPLANPFTAAADGYWFFFANDGPYDVQLSGAGIASPFTHAAGPLFDPRYLAPGSGAVARTVKTRLADYISLKDYGAKGDGTTDDTTAVQAAFAEAVALGTCLVVTPGTYMLSNTVQVSPGGGLVRNFCLTGPAGANWSFLGDPGGIAGVDGIAKFKALPGFSAGTVLDFRDTSGASVQNIAVEGIYNVSNCISFGATSDGDPNFGGFYSILGSRFTSCLHGIHNSLSGGMRVGGTQVENSVTCVFLDRASDYIFTDDFIHNCTQTVDYTGTDKTIGNGYYMIGNGNGQIHGGRIEFNDRGIYYETGEPMIFNSTLYDSNRWCHICLVGFSPKIEISGNRFRAGGSFNSVALGIGGAAISINPLSTFMRINVASNIFTSGSENPSGGEEICTGVHAGPLSTFRVTGITSPDTVLGVVGNYLRASSCASPGVNNNPGPRFTLDGASVKAYNAYSNVNETSITDVLTNGATVVPFSEAVVNSPSVTTQQFIVQPASGGAQVQVQQSALGQGALTGYLTKAVPTPTAPDYFTGMQADGTFGLSAFGISQTNRFLGYDPVLNVVNMFDSKVNMLSGQNIVPSTGQTCATLPAGTFGDFRLAFSCGASAGLCVAGGTAALAIFSGGTWRCIPIP